MAGLAGRVWGESGYRMGEGGRLEQVEGPPGVPGRSAPCWGAGRWSRWWPGFRHHRGLRRRFHPRPGPPKPPSRGDSCPFPQSNGGAAPNLGPGGSPCDSLLGPKGRGPRHLWPNGPRLPSAPPPGSVRSLLCLGQGPFLSGCGIRGPGHLGACTALSDRLQESTPPRLVPRTPPPGGFCSLGACGVGVAGWTVQRSEEGGARGRGCGRTKSWKTRGPPPTTERLTVTVGSVHLLSTKGTGPQGDRRLPHR